MFGLSNHVVVAVIDVLPGLLPLPGVRLKLTAFADRLTLTESVSVALRLIGWAMELRTCAEPATVPIANRTQAAPICTICVRKLIQEIRLAIAIACSSSRAEAFACCPRPLYSHGITESPVPQCSAFLYSYQPEAEA